MSKCKECKEQEADVRVPELGEDAWRCRFCAETFLLAYYKMDDIKQGMSRIKELESTFRELAAAKERDAKKAAREAWKRIDTRDFYVWEPEQVPARAGSFAEPGGLRFVGTLTPESVTWIEQFEAEYPGFLKAPNDNTWAEKRPSEKRYSVTYKHDFLPDGSVILSWYGSGVHLFTRPQWDESIGRSIDNFKPYLILTIQEWECFSQKGCF